MIKAPDLKIRETLSRKKRELEKTFSNLTKADPFQDKERLIDNASVDTEAREEVGHERVEALKQELATNLTRIKEALMSLARGQYGICQNCHKRIDRARLDVFPEAIFCIDCENKKESS